ncbi:MAG: GNAT family N-acetyltransferase [Pararhodobacter sp.]|nr:GNAT family N-acetyltransferase [Pararhodobacter sp.]
MTTGIDIRHPGAGDLAMVMAVAPGLFDKPLDAGQARAFLESPLNHLVLAYEGGQAVAFASGTVLLHPDKPPAMFINQLGTRESHRLRGFGRAVLEALIERARAVGCKGVWLGTETGNRKARAFYRASGGQEMLFAGYAWDGAFDDG